MKKLLLLLLCAVAGFTAGTGFNRYLDPSMQWLLELDAIKQAALERTRSEPRRILIVGDSNALFGIDTTVLTEETGVPSINLGFTAGQGMLEFLGIADAAMQRGDIIVLSLLPSSFTREPEAAKDGWIFAWLKGEPALAVGGNPPLVPVSATEWLSGGLSMTTPGLRRVVNWAARLGMGIKLFRYAGLEIDQTGYLVGRVNIPHPPSSEASPFDVGAAEVLREFQRRAERAGARVVYSLPWVEVTEEVAPTLRDAKGALVTKISEIMPALHDEDFGVKTDSGLFSDFQAHLSHAGAQQRARTLARELRASGMLD